jgi:glutamine---fructose-6-phosphate transaminase (isomerizing)
MENPILQSEINEQPSVIEKLLKEEKNNVLNISANIKGRFQYIIIAARGTSDNAARYAQYLFGIHNNLQVALATPSVISVYGQTPNMTGALVIGISQSGQSPDIVSVIAEGKKQNCPTLAITNDPLSPLARVSDFIIPLHAGLEKAVAATKTYTSSLAALVMLSCAFGDNSKAFAQLERMPAMMQSVIEAVAQSVKRTERYRYMDHCSVIGRGYNYSTAFEVALKVKELTRVTAEPYSSADFRHGPIATAQKGSPVMLIAPSGELFADMSDLIDQLKQKMVELILVSDNQNALKQADLPFPIPAGVPEWLSPLTTVLPGQLFALNLCMVKGLNPDQPEGLSKVTETL